MNQDVHFFTIVVPQLRGVVVSRFVRSSSRLDASLVWWEEGVLVGGLNDSSQIDPTLTLEWDPELTSPLETPSMRIQAGRPGPGWTLTVPAALGSVEFRPEGPAYSYPELELLECDGVPVYLERPCVVSAQQAGRSGAGVGLHGYRFGPSNLGENWHWAFGAVDDGSIAYNLYRVTDPTGRRLTGGWVRAHGKSNRVSGIEPIRPSRRTAKRDAIVVYTEQFSVTVEYEFDGQVLIASPDPSSTYTVAQQPTHLWIDGQPGYGVEEKATSV